MTTEEFSALLVMRGLSVADFDCFTYGMLINYIRGYDRIKAIMRGEDVQDEESQYKKLKQIEPIIDEQYHNGEINLQEYREFKESLAEYERGDING